MVAINTNVSATYSQNALTKNTRAMSTAMEQLSTGTRINSAKDDAAGLAISQNMTSQIRGLNMAIRDLNDGINMMQTAEGAMIEQSNMLQRMRELAVQANNGTYSNTQRSYLSLEYEALGSQIAKIATETKWNDQSLLVGTSGTVGAGTGTFTFQSGQASGQVISVTVSAMTLAGLGLANVGGISTAASAAGAIALIGSALETINLARAQIGAGINQMEYAVDNVANISSNTMQSRSTIMDTDYAQASTQLAKTQIIQQAATAMLAQANQQAQGVLSLLK
ncbi:MAG: flagellin FliC [Betaproteobacteria bacterium]|nr:flagellin FliC [Betaproteobacteria bacterium]